MAQLSAVLGILTPTGDRVDLALKQPGGGYLPVYLQLDSTFSYTATRNGPTVNVAIGMSAEGLVTWNVITAAAAEADSALDINGQKITGGPADPSAITADTDYTTKGYVDKVMGTTVTKSITLTANNATVAVPLFTVTGIVLVTRIYGVVTTAFGANHTGDKLQFNNGAITADISADGAMDMNGAPAGSLLMKMLPSSDPLLAAQAADGIFGDAGDVLTNAAFIAGKKPGETTWIEHVYTTTDTPTSGAVKWYVTYEPISDDGALVAA